MADYLDDMDLWISICWMTQLYHRFQYLYFNIDTLFQETLSIHLCKNQAFRSTRFNFSRKRYPLTYAKTNFFALLDSIRLFLKPKKKYNDIDLSTRLTAHFSNLLTASFPVITPLFFTHYIDPDHEFLYGEHRH